LVTADGRRAPFWTHDGEHMRTARQAFRRRLRATVLPLHQPRFSLFACCVIAGADAPADVYNYLTIVHSCLTEHTMIVHAEQARYALLLYGALAARIITSTCGPWRTPHGGHEVSLRSIRGSLYQTRTHRRASVLRHFVGGVRYFTAHLPCATCFYLSRPLPSHKNMAANGAY